MLNNFNPLDYLPDAVEHTERAAARYAVCPLGVAVTA